MLTDQSEAERAGDRRRLDKFDGHRITKPARRGAADESATGFVKAKVLLADAARRNKTVGAGFVSSTNNPARVTPEICPSKIAPTRSAKK